MRMHEVTKIGTKMDSEDFVEIRIPSLAIWLFILVIFHVSVLSFVSLFVCLLVWQTGSQVNTP